MRRRALTALLATLLAGWPAATFADAFKVTTVAYANLGAGAAIQANASYNSVTTGPYFNHTPVTVYSTGTGSATADGTTTPADGSATSSWDLAQASFVSSVQGVSDASSGAYAAASLHDGSLHIRAISSGSTANAIAQARLYDTLTFTNSGTADQAVWFSFAVDGSLAGTNPASGPSATFDAFFGLFDANGPSMTEVWQLDSGMGYVPTLAAGSPFVSSGWASTGWVSNTIHDIRFKGSYVISGGQTIAIPVWAELSCTTGRDVTCNYQNTARIGIDLPTGVSYTSASGVFLSQPVATPVPEPATISLVGLALLGLGRRLRFRS